MKKVLAIVMVLLMVLMAFAVVGGAIDAKKPKPLKPPKPPKGPKAVTWHVDDDGTVGVDCDFNTIQAAVNAASSGDKVKVEPGMYLESVTITKSIKLKGKDATIKCPSTPEDAYLAESSRKYEYTVGIFGGTYNAGTDTYSGSGTVSVDMSGFTVDANYYSPSVRWCSILLRNANKDKGKTKIHKNEIINANVNGKETFSILAYGTIDVEIKNNVIDQFARGGIGIYSGTAKIEKNEVIGPGLGVPVTWAPNGIQVGYGATATIKGNDVSGCGWPGTAWAGTAILIVDTSDVKVEKNYVHDSEQAIGVVDYPGGGFWSGVVSNVSVKNNIVKDNMWGLAISNDASNIVVEHNDFIDNGGDGIDVWTYSWHSGPAPTGIEIHNNNIAGNGYDGLWVGSTVTETVNAERNWWGDKSGPSGIGTGSGDSVIGNVDYEPWLKKKAK